MNVQPTNIFAEYMSLGNCSDAYFISQNATLGLHRDDTYVFLRLATEVIGAQTQNHGRVSSVVHDFSLLLTDGVSDRLPEARIAGQFGRFVGCLPGKVGVAAAEVAVRGGLFVDRTAQV